MPLRSRHGYAAGLHRGLPVGDINQLGSSRRLSSAPVRTASQPTSVRLELVVLLRSV